MIGSGMPRRFPQLRKTRNTKTLRQVVTSGDPGGLTTLLNPEAVEELKRVADA